MKQRMRDAYDLVFEQLQSVFDKAKRRYDPRVKFCRFTVELRVWYFCPRRFKNRSQSGVYKPLDLTKSYAKLTMLIRRLSIGFSISLFQLTEIYAFESFQLRSRQFSTL